MRAPLQVDLVRRARSNDLRVTQGATFQIDWLYPADFGSDWSGFAARCEFRRGPRNRHPDVLATFTALILDPVARQLRLYASPEVTALLTTRRGWYDIEIYNGTIVRRIQQGIWHLNEETTL